MYLDSFAVEFLDTEEMLGVSEIKKTVTAALLLLIIIVYLTNGKTINIFGDTAK